MFPLIKGHAVLTPPNPIAFVLLAANVYLAWAYRDAFRPMLAARVKPAVSASEPAVGQPVAV